MIESTQETEVSAKATRRRFTSEYKRRILSEAAACNERGELGALLRREGLYSSHLASWRVALAKSDLKALAPKKRGPVPKAIDPSVPKLIEAERQIARLQKRLERAEAIIDLQKKVSEILGIRLPDSDENR
jgi:transposase